MFGNANNIDDLFNSPSGRNEGGTGNMSMLTTHEIPGRSAKEMMLEEEVEKYKSLVTEIKRKADERDALAYEKVRIRLLSRIIDNIHLHSSSHSSKLSPPATVSSGRSKPHSLPFEVNTRSVSFLSPSAISVSQSSKQWLKPCSKMSRPRMQ